MSRVAPSGERAGRAAAAAWPRAPRVFVGLSEIARFTSNYAKGFRQNGCETFTVIGVRSPLYPDAEYDVVLADRLGAEPRSRLDVLRRSARARTLAASVFFRALRHCDAFLYCTGGSMLPRYLDYRLIRRRGKRLAVAFLGSEIRHWCPFEQEMVEMGVIGRLRPFVEHVKTHNYGTWFEKRERVRQAERWADVVLSQPGFAQLQTRPYMRVMAPLDLGGLACHVPARHVPLVLHAPTSRGVKGTEHVLAAVEALRHEGLEFEFRLIERLSHPQLRQVLSESDILVDELYSDTIGVLSAEGMATGNAVLTSYFDEYTRTPAGCPVQDVHPGTVREVLRRAISDREWRVGLATQGRAYVERHNDARGVAASILGWLGQGESVAPDFVPEFGRRFRMPPEVIAAERAADRAERRARFRRVLGR